MSGTISGVFPNQVDFSSVIDEIPLATALLDHDRRVLLLNRSFEAVTGFDLDRVWDVPFCHVLRSDLCPHRCPVTEADEKDRAVSREGDIIRRDRTKLPVRVTATPVRDGQGQGVGYLVTVERIDTAGDPTGALRDRYGFGQLLGRSPQMERVFKIIPVVAQTDSSILITGDTGTGKDVVAQVIHETSERSDGPFVKVNCGALPETLLESELFGHTKGAFTGAVADKPGRIRIAAEGTVYLTEIGDLPLPLQVKLLTFLDDKVVYPLGSTRGYQVDVRIVAATHRNLERMVREGSFREDLLYRLNVVRIHLPPLRERGGDIALLIDHFLKLFSSRFNKQVQGFSDQARAILLGYRYPGNVRELSNIIEYATNICQEKWLMPGHLPGYLLNGDATPQTIDEVPTEGRSVEDAPSFRADGADWGSVERKMILDALVRARGRRGQAAAMLGWSRSTLWRKMKDHRLEGSSTLEGA